MKETVIKVKGMVCNGCENRVKNIIKDIDGVESVIADYNTGIVKVNSRDDVSENLMKEKIEDIGFDVLE